MCEWFFFLFNPGVHKHHSKRVSIKWGEIVLSNVYYYVAPGNNSRRIPVPGLVDLWERGAAETLLPLCSSVHENE